MDDAEVDAADGLGVTDTVVSAEGDEVGVAKADVEAVGVAVLDNV